MNSNIDWKAVQRDYQAFCDLALEQFRGGGKVSRWELAQAVRWAADQIVEQYGYEAGIVCLTSFQKVMADYDGQEQGLVQ
jgi:hypothetical protein